MILERVHEYWTRVTRMVRGEVVQTTCCCAAPGMGRLDCQRAKGVKTPCRCACHGHVTQGGVRFRQIDNAEGKEIKWLNH